MTYLFYTIANKMFFDIIALIFNITSNYSCGDKMLYLVTISVITKSDIIITSSTWSWRTLFTNFDHRSMGIKWSNNAWIMRPIVEMPNIAILFFCLCTQMCHPTVW